MEWRKNPTPQAELGDLFYGRYELEVSSQELNLIFYTMVSDLVRFGFEGMLSTLDKK